MAVHNLLPTPLQYDYKQRQKNENRKGGDLASKIQTITGKGGRLNPRFVAEMMGFPINWTELPFQSDTRKA